MGRRISIDALADTVMEYLNDYADVSAEGMKKAVRKAGNTVKKEISTGFSDGIYIQVVEGLSEGDIVLIESRV